ncbi:MAG TPA: glycosyltransferase [Selenomonadales bacterium]|nr:glycosyltransferase [Selenomonadales bacterium]
MEQIPSSWHTDMSLAPIVLFVYNRPDHTRRTVEALQQNLLAKDSELYIYSDAPRSGANVESVSQVRNYIRGITGFKRVSIVERSENWGLARSVIDGVATVVRQHGAVIVMEDDLITSPFFLKFMNDALTVYADEPQVMQISGFTYPARFAGSDDTLFLPMAMSWGWATWRRAWDLFDEKATGYERLFTDKQLRDRFNISGSYNHTGLMKQQMSGEIDSWLIRWHWSVFKNNGLVLFPRQSLVSNIGLDGTGIHCNKLEDTHNYVSRDEKREIYVVKHNIIAVKNQHYDAWVKGLKPLGCAPQSFWRRLLSPVKKIIKKYLIVGKR